MIDYRICLITGLLLLSGVRLYPVVHLTGLLCLLDNFTYLVTLLS